MWKLAIHMQVSKVMGVSPHIQSSWMTIWFRIETTIMVTLWILETLHDLRNMGVSPNHPLKKRVFIYETLQVLGHTLVINLPNIPMISHGISINPIKSLLLISSRWFLPTSYFRGVKQRGVLLPGGCGRRLAGQIFRRYLSDDHSLVTVVAGTPKKKGWRKIHYVTAMLRVLQP